MPREAEVQRSRLLARRLAEIRPITKTQVGISLFLSGALLSILRAAELDYDDERKRPSPTALHQESLAVTSALADPSAAIPTAWLASYYFSNAILRLNGSADRLKRMAPKEPNVFWEADPLKYVRKASNKLLDVPDGHHDGWLCTLPILLDAAEVLVSALTDAATRNSKVRARS